MGDVSTLLLFLMNPGAILKSFFRLSGAVSMLATRSFSCLLSGSAFSNPRLQCSKMNIQLFMGQVSRSEGWVELAENFLEPFAKGLRFCSRKSRQNPDGFTGVVSVFIVRDI